MGYLGAQKLKLDLAKRPGIKNPGAVLATIGRKKYGAGKFNAFAARGKKMKGVKAIRFKKPRGAAGAMKLPALPRTPRTLRP